MCHKLLDGDEILGHIFRQGQGAKLGVVAPQIVQMPVLWGPWAAVHAVALGLWHTGFSSAMEG